MNTDAHGLLLMRAGLRSMPEVGWCAVEQESPQVCQDAGSLCLALNDPCASVFIRGRFFLVGQ
jgi:hypothetical protein